MATATFAEADCGDATLAVHYDTVTLKLTDVTVDNPTTDVLHVTVSRGAFSVARDFAAGSGATVIPITSSPTLTKAGRFVRGVDVQMSLG